MFHNFKMTQRVIFQNVRSIFFYFQNFSFLLLNSLNAWSCLLLITFKNLAILGCNRPCFYLSLLKNIC